MSEPAAAALALTVALGPWIFAAVLIAMINAKRRRASRNASKGSGGAITPPG